MTTDRKHVAPMENLKFRIFTRRWNSDITYRINVTEHGWHITHLAINGECNPDGSPFFYSNFEQDQINYPSGFGAQLGWLWENIKNGELDREEAQAKLQELADWVSRCEESTPKWHGWNS